MISAGFRNFFGCIYGVGKSLDPRCDPHWLAVGGSAGYCQLVPSGCGEMAGKVQIGQKSAGERVSALRRLGLHDLRHEATDFFWRLPVFISFIYVTFSIALHQWNIVRPS